MSQVTHVKSRFLELALSTAFVLLRLRRLDFACNEDVLGKLCAEKSVVRNEGRS